jgi:hypothetical protein
MVMKPNLQAAKIDIPLYTSIIVLLVLLAAPLAAQ